MPNEKTLGTRLSSALAYVTPGGCVADIGTDHAYLPIELIRRGICARAVACDIGEGPLLRAKEHIAAAGLSLQIPTLLTNGLQGVRAYAPTDIIIFGMGGELIAQILREAPWVKTERTNLILQPMTKAEVLRRFLCENGLEILGESLTYEEHHYQTIHARHTGKQETYTEAELLLGKARFHSTSPHYQSFLRRHLRLLTAVIEGKRQGGADVTREQALAAHIRTLLSTDQEEFV